MRGILLFLGLTLCSAAVGADRQPDFYCKQISIESGLSQSSVTSLLRDRRGLLWIGTRSGLNLFDRDDLTNYFHDRDDARSIPGNYIYHLSEDCRGRIWVATDGGLAVYDRSTDGFRTVTEELVFSSAVVGERIYFGGKKVLYRYDCTTDEMENIYFTGIEPYNVSPDYHITGIERLDPHSLLLATPGKGVFRYDDRSRKVGPFLELPSTATLTSLYVSADGTVWLSLFKRGLFHYDASGRFLRRYGSADSGLSNDIILDLAEYNGRLWLATDGGGINILNLATSEVRILRHIPGDAGSLPVNSITVLYNDSGNNLWAGTVRGGLLGIKTTHMRVFPDATLGSHYGLSERSVISLYEDADGIVWVGTDGGGLNRYDPATNNFTHYESTYGDKITSITELSPGRLLLSAYSKGLSVFDTSSGRTTPFVIENAMTNLREIGSGFQQLAHRVSDDKIYILSRQAIVYDIPHRRFRYMGYDPKTVDPGAMFLVYSDTVRSYGIQKNRIYEIRQADDSIRLMHTLDAHETISALCHDGGDRIWIGTNHGLFRYDRAADSVFAVKTNLFDEISAMQLDSRGRLWIGAHNMLFSYDTREERFSIWGEADGFSSNELLYTYQSTPRHGNVYLGGTGGLVRIREDISFEEESVPTVSLGEALLDGRICLPDPAGRIRIPWNYRTLTVKVALNEEDVFHRPLLRYEIHGKSTRRIETFDHRLDLSMLSPGDWLVDVSCSTRSGGWTTPAPLLSVFVRQAWYKTPLFFGLTLLFLMSAVLYAAYRVFRRRERHLQWELKLREQSVNEEKIRFLINISHELRTPLVADLRAVETASFASGRFVVLRTGRAAAFDAETGRADEGDHQHGARSEQSGRRTGARETGLVRLQRVGGPGCRGFPERVCEQGAVAGFPARSGVGPGVLRRCEMQDRVVEFSDECLEIQYGSRETGPNLHLAGRGPGARLGCRRGPRTGGCRHRPAFHPLLPGSPRHQGERNRTLLLEVPDRETGRAHRSLRQWQRSDLLVRHSGRRTADCGVSRPEPGRVRFRRKSGTSGCPG